MKMPDNHCAAKAGGAVAFLAMAVLGWEFAGGSAVPVAGKSRGEAPVARDSRPPRAFRSSGISRVALQQLAVIRACQNPTERMRATIDLANSLPLSDFAAWLDGSWFDLRNGTELTVFTRLIQERWRLEDSEGYAFRNLVGNPEIAYRILDSLAGKDPQRVVEFFKIHSDPGRELRILGDLANQHPALALQCLRDLDAAGISRSDSYAVAVVLRQIAKKQPAEAEAFIGALSGEPKIQALGVLISEKMNTDYAGELRKLVENPDGLKIYNYLEEKRSVKFFDELANLPPRWRTAVATEPSRFFGVDGAVKCLTADLVALGFSDVQEQAIRRYAMDAAAATKPEAVFQVMEDYGFVESERRRLIQKAISGKGDRAESVIASLTSEQDREFARSLTPPPSTSSPAPRTIETPAQWLDQVASFGSQADIGYFYRSMIGGWDEAKIAEFTEQFKSLPDAKKQVVALVIARDISGDIKPALTGEAIRTLVANPNPATASEASRMASDYVGKLAARDPETASEWIRSLPDGESKTWAQLNLHGVWSRYDPKAAEQWFKTLPAATQTKVESLKKK